MRKTITPGSFCEHGSCAVQRLSVGLLFSLILCATVTRAQVNDTTPEPGHVVSGQVISADSGDPLPGVNILIKGTAVGTTTDNNGDYSIAIPSGSAVLVFSFIGFEQQEIMTGNRDQVNVSLVPAIASLSEVVVVGYGTQKKLNLTGAVGSVNQQELAGIPTTNVTAMMQGRIPGVSITQNSGLPGREEMNILIRGLGTMNNSSPMVIVDGIEASMNDIAALDIESISVLKDAASSAIYGTRAANGVILVTTKRGKEGVSAVNYNAYFGYQRPTNLVEHLPSDQYAVFINEGRVNEGLSPQYSESDIALFASGEDPFNYPNTNWVDLIMQGSGFTQNHNVSFSGGSTDTRFRTSLEYYNQHALIRKTEKNRYNFRLNLDHKVKQNFVVGTNLALTRIEVENPLGARGDGDILEIFKQANGMPPILPNKLADGSWGRWTDGNPVAFIEEDPTGKFSQQGSEFLGSMFAELELFDGLKVKGIAGANYRINDNKRHQTDIIYGDGSYQGPNSVSDELIRFSNMNLQGLITYEKTIGAHSVNVLLGSQVQSETTKFNNLFRNILPSNLLDQIDAASEANDGANGSIIESKLNSYFGRVNYSFRDKYLIEANLRRDASSKFARDNRVGLFPSISGAWRISAEPFFGKLSESADIKLRASWGRLGNHRIDDYRYIQSVTLGQNYTFGGALANGAATVSAGNPDISWETTTETDIGVDLSIFKAGLISLSVDYYNRYTTDILTAVPVSQTFGLPAPIVNAGAMRNKGVEFLLNHRNNLNGLSYDVSFNMAVNDNNVEIFPNPVMGATIRAEGYAWDSFYGYEVLGIFQSDAEAADSPILPGSPAGAGDFRYKDQNGDGVINGLDRVDLGSSIPRITYGVNLNLSYKQFDISAFLQGADKVYRTLGAWAMWPLGNNYGNPSRMHLDRTIVDNGVVVQQGRYPRILMSQGHNRAMSSFQVLDASYLRVRNLQIGYTFSSDLLNRINVSRARVYLNGQNLFTISDFPDGFDPEVANGRADYYPQVKFYTMGVDITF